MATLRHKAAIARIRAGNPRLTRRERQELGLAPEPVLRALEPPPFPAHPEQHVWFALMTLPQREASVARGLSRAGFAAFNPSETVLVRGNRMTRHKRAERQRALLTSMVLVGLPGRVVQRRVPAVAVPDGNGGRRHIPERWTEVLAADVPWPTIREIDGVAGIIGMGDEPCPVPLMNILALRRLSGRRSATRNWTPAVGAPATVAFGPFQGQAGEVIELADGKVRLALFGATGVFASLVQPLCVPESWVREMIEGRTADLTPE